MKKFYVAYGSNLNLSQMAFRCPTAKVVGKGKIKDWSLEFWRVATIVPNEGEDVPVGVWEIDEICEKALDRYEGFPRLYRKEDIEVEMFDGSKVTGMVYIMNKENAERPSMMYYHTIKTGYEEIGFDPKKLYEALKRSVEKSA